MYANCQLGSDSLINPSNSLECEVYACNNLFYWLMWASSIWDAVEPPVSGSISSMLSTVLLHCCVLYGVEWVVVWTCHVSVVSVLEVDGRCVVYPRNTVYNILITEFTPWRGCNVMCSRWIIVFIGTIHDFISLLSLCPITVYCTSRTTRLVCLSFLPLTKAEGGKKQREALQRRCEAGFYEYEWQTITVQCYIWHLRWLLIHS